jgi:hypothetical protein
MFLCDLQAAVLNMHIYIQAFLILEVTIITHRDPNQIGCKNTSHINWSSDPTMLK